MLPEEVPVALVYDGTTHAVMMASPADLEDFAIGFSLTEGKIAPAGGDRRARDRRRTPRGIEARMWLVADAGARRRPAGGAHARPDRLRALRHRQPRGRAAARCRRCAGGPTLSPAEVAAAVASLRPAQRLNAEAHALHAAGFWTPGARARRAARGRRPAQRARQAGRARWSARASIRRDGVVVLTSRLSVEMVQKAAAVGAPVIAAVSAPTALALRTAEAAGITVVAVAATTASRSSPAPTGSRATGDQGRRTCVRPVEKLVMMANQIARNLAVQGEEAAIAATADHLRRFWDPRMRAAIVAYVDGDGRLDPIAAAAVRRLAGRAEAR